MGCQGQHSANVSLMSTATTQCSNLGWQTIPLGLVKQRVQFWYISTVKVMSHILACPSDLWVSNTPKVCTCGKTMQQQTWWESAIYVKSNCLGWDSFAHCSWTYFLLFCALANRSSCSVSLHFKQSLQHLLILVIGLVIALQSRTFLFRRRRTTRREEEEGGEEGCSVRCATWWHTCGGFKTEESEGNGLCTATISSNFQLSSWPTWQYSCSWAVSTVAIQNLQVNPSTGQPIKWVCTLNQLQICKCTVCRPNSRNSTSRDIRGLYTKPDLSATRGKCASCKPLYSSA